MTQKLQAFWRKIDLWFGKWHDEFGKFSSEHLKVSKLVLSSFCSKYKMHELKIYRGIMGNDTKELWKVLRGIDLLFKNWHKEFDKFWLENLKVSKTYTLMGCFWPKYIMFELRKYRVVMFDGTQDWYKVWRKTDLCFQK